MTLDTNRRVVGRDEEIGLIRAKAGQVIDQGIQLVVVTGLPGVGKSSLVHRALEPYADWNLLVYALDEQDQAQPGFVAHHMLGDERLPDASGGVDTLFSAALGRANELSDPMILVLDNFQWADDASVEAGWRAMRELDDVPLMVVIVMRSPVTSPQTKIVRLAHADPIGVHIPLEPLNHHDTKELLGQLSGAVISEEIATRVYAVTVGYPTHVEFIGRWLQRTPLGNGRRIDDAIAALHDSLSNANHPYRRSAEFVMGQYGKAEQDALTLLAIAQQPLSSRGVAQALGREDADLAPLMTAGLVKWEPHRYGYRLLCGSFARALRARKSDAQLVQWHEQLAGISDGVIALRHRLTAVLLHPDPAAEDELVSDAMRMGQIACEQHSFDVAAECFLIVCRVRPEREITEQLVRAGGRPGARKHLVPAVQQIADLPLGALRSAGLAHIGLEQSKPEGVLDELAEVTRLPVDDPEALLAYARAVAEAGRTAMIHGVAGAYAEVFASTEQVLGSYEAGAGELSSAQRAEVDGLRGLLEIWKLFSDGAEYTDMSAEMGRVIDRLAAGERDDAARGVLRPIRGAVHVMRAAHLRRLGVWQTAFDELQKAQPKLHGSWRSLSIYARACMVLLLFGAGRWDQADELGRKIAATGLEYGEDATTLMAYAVAALVPAVRGEAYGDQLLARVEENSELPFVQSSVDYVKAWRAIVTEQHHVAADLLLKIADATVPRIDVGMLAMLTRSLYYSGRPEALWTVIGTIEDERVQMPDALRAALATYARGLAAPTVEEQVERLFDAMDWLGHMSPVTAPLLIAERSGLRIQGGLLGIDIATLIVENPVVLAGQRARGIELAALSATFFQSCGATVLADRATMLLDALRADKDAATGRTGASLHDLHESHEPAGGPMSLLTKREQEIARLVAKGYANSEIAQDLFISVRTVEKHVANILRKRGLHSRVELRRQLRAVDDSQSA